MPLTLRASSWQCDSIAEHVFEPIWIQISMCMSFYECQEKCNLVHSNDILLLRLELQNPLASGSLPTKNKECPLVRTEGVTLVMAWISGDERNGGGGKDRGRSLSVLVNTSLCPRLLSSLPPPPSKRRGGSDSGPASPLLPPSQEFRGGPGPGAPLPLPPPPSEQRGRVRYCGHLLVTGRNID